MFKFLKIICILFLIFSCLSFAKDSKSSEQELNVDWISGGKKIAVGTKFADINLDKELLYLNEKDTKTFQEANYNNESTGLEIGSIYPKDEKESWYVVIEYEEVGYIKDNEKIDQDKLLKEFINNQNEYNKQNIKEPKSEVVGWEKAPYYDEKLHTIAWSILYKQDVKGMEQYANHFSKLLTRRGFISFILVAETKDMDKARKILSEKIIPSFEVRAGNKYSDYNSKVDKKAEFGITGVILGTAGIAAAKNGGLAFILLLFKKAWILIAAAVAGVIGFLKKIFSKKENIE